jgi:Reverse transcriptase (RNA-dependent DNA polymerase)
MAQELDAFSKNHIWDIVFPPPNANIIGCKLIFKIKKRVDGFIQWYKAYLIAKGYTQEEGLNYFDTFSSVVKPTAIKIVLTIALSNGWSMRQLDVNNVFLHEILKRQFTCNKLQILLIFFSSIMCAIFTKLFMTLCLVSQAQKLPVSSRFYMFIIIQLSFYLLIQGSC